MASTGQHDRTFFEIELDRATAGSRDAGRGLHRQLRAAIADGRLKAGTKLPPTRKAAAYFGVSRNTAVDVYERLLNEGYLVARHGSGTYVAETLPLAPPPAVSGEGAAPEGRLNAFWLRGDVSDAMGFWRDRDEPAGRARPASGIDFRPALIDARLFPLDELRRTMAQQLRRLERKPARFTSPQGNPGNYRLREAITSHIALTRAVVCRPDEIVVTSGAQQAFDLLARIVVTPGETVVAVEDPGYPPMRVAFAAAGARIVPVPVDADGLIVEQLPANAGVVCVSPSHHFPLGVTMSARRRRELIAFARAHRAVIVEDDYDGEFRYEGNPLQALRSADAAEVVFYVGTFSKCMLPSLRLGFVVAPAWAMRTLVAAKNALDWHSSTPIQLGVAGFIAGGHLARHVRKMRRLYRARRERLLAGLRADLAAWLDPLPSFYGMHVAALARTPCDLEMATHTLAQAGVHVHTLQRYYLGGPAAQGLVFGYGAADVDEIERGLTSLRAALGS
ncbi:MAG TPA: PLP-dependent aminotransferase family protein [Candidatus Sulfotelmatobacter sp.]|nr:PLP-dependent aminotransferase family protein [Candidatus Sulfotelmatobacter sp.]